MHVLTPSVVRHWWRRPSHLQARRQPSEHVGPAAWHRRVARNGQYVCGVVGVTDSALPESTHSFCFLPAEMRQIREHYTEDEMVKFRKTVKVRGASVPSHAAPKTPYPTTNAQSPIQRSNASRLSASLFFGAFTESEEGAQQGHHVRAAGPLRDRRRRSHRRQHGTASQPYPPTTPHHTTPDPQPHPRPQPSTPPPPTPRRVPKTPHPTSAVGRLALTSRRGLHCRRHRWRWTPRRPSRSSPRRRCSSPWRPTRTLSTTTNSKYLTLPPAFPFCPQSC